MTERKVELYQLYSEFGYRGAREVRRTYTLILTDQGTATVATLEEEVTEESFPDSGDKRSTRTRTEIKAEEVVEFIQTRGRQVR